MTREPRSLNDFIREISEVLGIPVPASWPSTDDVEVARHFVTHLNAFVFQTYEELGSTAFNNEELRYFSEFHRFWEAHHREILSPEIDQDRSRVVAQALSGAVRRYGGQLLFVSYPTQGLAPHAVAQVRFFTANQDFREPPENQFGRYLDNPGQFDADEVAEDPAGFLRFLGLTRLSQTDKRLDFARNAALFLITRGITPFEIASHFGNDAFEIRKQLVNAQNIGYGAKKANMFIRDMFELEVWPDLFNLASIDVASDINTMKLALRTGILRTAIPLLSSFLDVFCHQYACIEDASAAAWRAVWEQWCSLDSETAPSSPCQMDYLLYRIGREYCLDNVVTYSCERGHQFSNFGAGIRNCRVCTNNRERTPAHQIARVLPCQIESSQLPREDGRLLRPPSNLLSTFDGVCILEAACQPKRPDFRPLDPPKSISVKGQTGWTSSYAERDRGGGGMMG